MRKVIIILLIPIYLLIIVSKNIGELFFEAFVEPIKDCMINLTNSSEKFWNQILKK